MTALSTLALSRLDTLLLRAALLDGDPARAAYGALSDDFDLDGLDKGRHRLLPLLHRNLTALGIDDPRIGRLRGIRHYHWAKNQVRTRSAAPVLAALRAAAIPAVLLKGAALLAAGLGDMSLRPMEDIDILVPPEKRIAAVDILAAHGFEPRNVPRWYLRGDEDFPVAGWQFANAAGDEIDLHWHLLHLDRRGDADAGVWSRVRPAVLAGTATAVLAPSDQIMHTIAHAARWSDDSLLRWAADVALILRREGAAMDWSPLVAEARRRRIAPPLHDGLAALRAAVALPIPESVIADLRRLVGPLGRFEHRLRAHPQDQHGRATLWWLDVFDARRASADALRRPLPAAIGPYIRARFPKSAASTPNLLLYAMLGAPRALRGPLGIGRLPCDFVPAELAELSAGFVPGTAGRDAAIAGWSFPEPGGRWSVAREARLAWRVPPDWRADLEVEIEAAPLWPPGRKEPRVDVWVGDTHLGRLPPSGADGPALFRARVPAAALAGRAVAVLTLAVQHLVSPLELGLSLDARKLGVFLRRVEFRRAETPAQP